jgi:hypothetical protein
MAFHIVMANSVERHSEKKAGRGRRGRRAEGQSGEATAEVEGVTSYILQQVAISSPQPRVAEIRFIWLVHGET